MTVTRAPLNEAGGKVAKGLYNTQLSLGKTKLTVYPGDSINVPIQAKANFMEKFWVPLNPVIISGVKPIGGFLETAGTATITSRSAEFKGTVAMNQSAGDYTIRFAVKGKQQSGKEDANNRSATVTADLNVIVLELAKKYTPELNKKVTVNNPNNVTQVEKDKIIANVKQENPTLPEGTTYSVDNNGNVTITYPDASQDKISAAYSIQTGSGITGVAPEIVNDLAGKASTIAVVTVKAQAGSTVKLYDSNDVLIGEAVANAQGKAIINPTNSLPEGTITATSTPVGGEESPLRVHR